MDDLTTEEFEAAKARGDALLRGPRAVSAHYDAGRHRVIVRLTTGVELGLAPRDVEGLQNATSDALKAIEIDACGLGIHFPRLDADLYVPALLAGIPGSQRWEAARRAAAEGGIGNARRREAVAEKARRGDRRPVVAASHDG